MTEDQITAYFARYAEAFSNQDVETICALWDYPALLSSEGRQTVVDQELFRQNLTGLLSFYGSQGVARAKAEVADVAILTETTASVRVDYQLHDEKNEEVARWQHVYVVSDTLEGVKICVSLPDAEVKAWRDLGVLPDGP